MFGTGANKKGFTGTKQLIKADIFKNQGFEGKREKPNNNDFTLDH